MKIITPMLILFSLYAHAQTVSKTRPSKKNVIFEVSLDTAIKTKPYLLIYEHGIDKGDFSMVGKKRVQAKSMNGKSYVFELKDQTKPLYFSIFVNDPMPDLAVVDGFHFEPGDNMKIKVKKTRTPMVYDLEFSGKGSAKYRCQNEFKYAVRKDTVKRKPEFSKGNLYNINNVNEANIKLLYNLIEKHRPEMSDYSYNLLHADVLGEMGEFILNALQSRLLDLRSKKDTIGIKNLADDFTEHFKYDYVNNIPKQVLADSKSFPGFLVDRIKCETLMTYGFMNYNIIYERIKNTSNIELRDRMILSFFLKCWGKIGVDFNNMLTNALSLVKDNYCLDRLSDFKRNQVGERAFNFSLSDVNGRRISLADFKGKIVFIDFWFTGCGACEKYFKGALSKVEDLYKNNHEVVFITVCIDKSKEQWINSIKSGNYTSSKAINLYTDGKGTDHDLIQYYNIMSYPRPMLIGRKGEIIKLNGSSELRRVDQLIAEINKAL